MMLFPISPSPSATPSRKPTPTATATGNILTQLQNQQSSIEGVSLDEESSNLMLYERSYQAAAKVISTIDTLMGNVLDMGVTDPGY